MLGNIFNVFSRRRQPEKSPKHPLTSTFRNRIMMLVRDSLRGDLPFFLEELQQKMAYLHGKPSLSGNNSRISTVQDDIYNFLQTCEDAYFLDAIEYFFQIGQGQYFRGNQEAVIDHINEFFEVDNLPYFITKAVWEEYETDFHGTKTTGYKLREHPKVICRENDIVHNNAVEPALSLLREPDLLNANSEFLEALEDYRQGQYKDCLTKCNSAFESVMKVICHRNRYNYSEKDAANRLIKTILDETSLDAFWEQPLQVVATIRNKLSSSHGAGLQNKDVSKHIAKFTINATAAAILLLHDEAY
ncbi:hypothetical protein CRV00_00805 [Malaciobacter molluscorum]|uniref:abortive infection family protein n=1 Tax=Malaciobacter molluscorum TaxID=1032072 RepID=UPI00100BD76E|nr:abortive infection family protein [Malaciobacter molluscorum]RXJ97406.1 hypothetical protein CRV00_00805 [Malaciobacter molluscorum]